MTFDPDITDITQVIQLAVAPVFLLTGIGAILTVMTNRLARAVDRARFLQHARMTARPDERGALVAESGVVGRRIHLAHRAIAFAVFSELCVCLLIALAFLGAAAKLHLAPVVAGLFVLAMLSLIVTLLIFLREIMLSVTSVRTLLKPT
jgi:hypothetical protein